MPPTCHLYCYCHGNGIHALHIQTVFVIFHHHPSIRRHYGKFVTASMAVSFSTPCLDPPLVHIRAIKGRSILFHSNYTCCCMCSISLHPRRRYYIFVLFARPGACKFAMACVLPHWSVWHDVHHYAAAFDTDECKT